MATEPARTQGSAAAPRGSRKSKAAFRTIGEASEELGVPQHVLRFWETKFAQLKPLKRAGGRRYYRPEDMALLTRIRDLLYQEGFTIKGARRHLQQKGSSSDATEVKEVEEESASADGAEQAAAEPAGEAVPPSTQTVSAAETAGPLFEATPKGNDEAAALRATLRHVLGDLVALRQSLKSHRSGANL
ncbi:MAG: hypothetical protein Kilf2KO_39920 [Rhodospirillales bacterium]